jgi:DNA-binding IclR family transcriptional regulator
MLKGTIQSLDRGLKILAILGKSDKPMTINDITGHFDMDRSSIFRLVSTLLKNNFVSQDEETKKYTLGFRFMELAGAFNEQTQIETILRPIMNKICLTTRQNTHLAVLDGNEVVFIAVEMPRDTISMNISIGTREPSTATALGKIHLAFMDEKARKKIIEKSQLTAFTNNTITSKNAFIEHLEIVRNNKIAEDNEEYKSGIICFAAPVFNHRKEVMYSIGISGPSGIIKPHFKEFAELIKNSGIDASKKFGYIDINNS